MVVDYVISDGKLSVAVEGREIITHSKENPWIFVGKGSATYDMYRGNFKISDYLSEKVALTDFTARREEDGLVVTFSRGGVYFIKVLFREENGRSIVQFIDQSSEINRLWLRLAAEEDEKVYGCGEQFSYFNLRGKNFPLWTSEQGVGRNKNDYITFRAESEQRKGGDYYTTYYPQPTFISTRKYYCHVADSSYMDFDFSNKDYHELQIWSVPEKLIFEAADHYVDVVGKLSGLLGRQPELPEWVYNGVWMGVQGGTEIALNKLENALEKGVKIAGVWTQDWSGRRLTSFGKRVMWNWRWNPELYPDLDKAIGRLNERGIKYLGYINPYLASDKDIFQEASEQGFLVQNKEGNDYLVHFEEFSVGLVDFTNPQAFDWYKQLIKKNMIEFGLAGWMADFSEYLPADAVLWSRESAEKIHNQWPVLWAKVNREAVEEAGKMDEITFFMRAGYTGSQKYCNMIWAGDQNVDWSLDDGLASVIPAALSLGMSGYGLSHSDIGGYTTLFGMKRTKELFIRWAEMSAFTPIMRTHEGNRPDDNWQFDSDDETLMVLGRLSQLYTQLASYLKQAVRENAEKGIPVMRPLFMHYEEDQVAYEIKYQYLLGRDLLVAPVYLEGKDKWTVYLPKDEWVHFWTGETFRGGEVEVDAPLGYLPVFYRKASEHSRLFEEAAAAYSRND